MFHMISFLIAQSPALPLVGEVPDVLRELRDLCATGRTAASSSVAPINRRDQKLDDLNWSNCGIDAVRGGAVREEDSIITAENGFTGITYLPPGTSPDSHIEMLVKGTGPAAEA
jgi:hypothetical protein